MTSEEIDLDSESDSGSDYSVTQTQLGVSDGPIENEDVFNPLVSRMGGKVAWLPSKGLPPVDVSRCKHCCQQMELLVQIFAPLDESPYDRLLLVWGCARKPCQKKGKGFIRAVRFLTFNARWAAKLEKKRKRQEVKEARQRESQAAKIAREKDEEAKRKTNPFTSKVLNEGGLLSKQSLNPFSSPISSATESIETTAQEERDEDEESDDEMDDLAEEVSIKVALDTIKREEPDWSINAPSYQPALYLNTYSEPSSSARAYETSMEAKKQLEKFKKSGGNDMMKGWEAEKYESMMAPGIDETFERFIKRVSPNGKQVVRYEFGGTPLAFHARGAAYEKLWPKIRPDFVTINGKGSKVIGREYSSKGISACPLCGADRVFELQLMPNLVNTLKADLIQGGEEGTEEKGPRDAEEKRKREIEEALGHRLPDKPDADGITRSKVVPSVASSGEVLLASRSGLQWSTAMIFVCEKDCRGNTADQSEIWSEEEVEIQFEHE